MTLLVRAGRIEACFHPVFPPDADAEHVLAWLRGFGMGTGVLSPSA